MSAERVPVDDPEVLRRILTNAEALLLDFDGPVCSVFAGIPAHLVAHQLRGVLADGGHEDLPAEIEKAEDPFDVLRYAAVLGRDEARYVEAALTAHESEAMDTAKPTERAHELIHRCTDLGIPIGIASNNSNIAIEAYLAKWRLTGEVGSIAGRKRPDPILLKPNPHLLIESAASLNVAIDACVFVGDSLTDIEAANRIDMKIVGFANKSRKVEEFRGLYRPSAIVTELGWLIDTIHS